MHGHWGERSLSERHVHSSPPLVSRPTRPEFVCPRVPAAIRRFSPCALSPLPSKPGLAACALLLDSSWSRVGVALALALAVPQSQWPSPACAHCSPPPPLASRFSSSLLSLHVRSCTDRDGGVDGCSCKRSRQNKVEILRQPPDLEKSRTERREGDTGKQTSETHNRQRNHTSMQRTARSTHRCVRGGLLSELAIDWKYRSAIVQGSR